MKHEIIKSGNHEFVKVHLAPNEEFISESGAMMYMQTGIDLKAIIGNSRNEKGGLLDSIGKIGKRVLSGEGVAQVSYINNENKELHLGITSPFPGEIASIELDGGGDLILQRGSYLASTPGLRIELATTTSISSTILGGEGLFMQRVSGKGTLFINACGSVYQLSLEPNEEIQVDEGCLVGFTEGVNFRVGLSSTSLSTMLFSGEGACLSKLQAGKEGGTVLLQSMPIEKMANVIQSHMKIR